MSEQRWGDEERQFYMSPNAYRSTIDLYGYANESERRQRERDAHRGESIISDIKSITIREVRKEINSDQIGREMRSGYLVASTALNIAAGLALMAASHVTQAFRVEESMATVSGVDKLNESIDRDQETLGRDIVARYGNEGEKDLLERVRVDDALAREARERGELYNPQVTERERAEASQIVRKYAGDISTYAGIDRSVESIRGVSKMIQQETQLERIKLDGVDARIMQEERFTCETYNKLSSDAQNVLLSQKPNLRDTIQESSRNQMDRDIKQIRDTFNLDERDRTVRETRERLTEDFNREVSKINRNYVGDQLKIELEKAETRMKDKLKNEVDSIDKKYNVMQASAEIKSAEGRHGALIANLDAASKNASTAINKVKLSNEDKSFMAMIGNTNSSLNGHRAQKREIVGIIQRNDNMVAGIEKHAQRLSHDKKQILDYQTNEKSKAKSVVQNMGKMSTAFADKRVVDVRDMLNRNNERIRSVEYGKHDKLNAKADRKEEKAKRLETKGKTPENSKQLAKLRNSESSLRNKAVEAHTKAQTNNANKITRLENRSINLEKRLSKANLKADAKVDKLAKNELKLTKLQAKSDRINKRTARNRKRMDKLAASGKSGGLRMAMRQKRAAKLGSKSNIVQTKKNFFKGQRKSLLADKAKGKNMLTLRGKMKKIDARKKLASSKKATKQQEKGVAKIMRSVNTIDRELTKKMMKGNALHNEIFGTMRKMSYAAEKYEILLKVSKNALKVLTFPAMMMGRTKLIGKLMETRLGKVLSGGAGFLGKGVGNVLRAPSTILSAPMKLHNLPKTLAKKALSGSLRFTRKTGGFVVGHAAKFARKGARKAIKIIGKGLDKTAKGAAFKQFAKKVAAKAQKVFKAPSKLLNVIKTKLGAIISSISGALTSLIGALMTAIGYLCIGLIILLIIILIGIYLYAGIMAVINAIAMLLEGLKMEAKLKVSEFPAMIPTYAANYRDSELELLELFAKENQPCGCFEEDLETHKCLTGQGTIIPSTDPIRYSLYGDKSWLEDNPTTPEEEFKNGKQLIDDEKYASYRIDAENISAIEAFNHAVANYGVNPDEHKDDDVDFQAYPKRYDSVTFRYYTSSQFEHNVDGSLKVDDNGNYILKDDQYELTSSGLKKVDMNGNYITKASDVEISNAKDALAMVDAIYTKKKENPDPEDGDDGKNYGTYPMQLPEVSSYLGIDQTEITRYKDNSQAHTGLFWLTHKLDYIRGTKDSDVWFHQTAKTPVNENGQLVYKTTQTMKTYAGENLGTSGCTDFVTITYNGRGSGGSGYMKTSKEGQDFIIWEECRGRYSQSCFWDSLQYTIGYGTKCKESGPHPHTISEPKARMEFFSDISGRENELNSFIRKYDLSLSQNQFDALMSFSYNCGTSWMYKENYDINKAVRYGWTGEQLRSAFTAWSNAIINNKYQFVQGLFDRRNREADLYLESSPVSIQVCQGHLDLEVNIVVSIIEDDCNDFFEDARKIEGLEESYAVSRFMGVYSWDKWVDKSGIDFGDKSLIYAFCPDEDWAEGGELRELARIKATSDIEYPVSDNEDPESISQGIKHTLRYEKLWIRIKKDKSLSFFDRFNPPNRNEENYIMRNNRKISYAQTVLDNGMVNYLMDDNGEYYSFKALKSTPDGYFAYGMMFEGKTYYVKNYVSGRQEDVQHFEQKPDGGLSDTSKYLTVELNGGDPNISWVESVD